MEIVTEAQFNTEIRKALALRVVEVDCVTGPGRSGAIAAVYASHILHIPFIPYGQDHPLKFNKILVIDTATETGKTLRRAAKKYPRSVVMAVYREPPRVAFWYEGEKPQRYKHETSPWYQLEISDKYNGIIQLINDFQEINDKSAIEWVRSMINPPLPDDNFIVNLYKTSGSGREFIYHLNGET